MIQVQVRSKILLVSENSNPYHDGTKHDLSAKSSTNPPVSISNRKAWSTLSYINFGLFTQGKQLNPFKENIDWTRGRFVGNVEKITIKNGLVIEKTFVTSKGTIIKVKRSELGFLLWALWKTPVIRLKNLMLSN
ncbi:hypothetical protein EV04_0547 [Prochlorococcus marinus str. LG]|nr:hypothetical protein EV04_0547 [Prochlorococcus marinus str. LG]